MARNDIKANLHSTTGLAHDCILARSIGFRPFNRQPYVASHARDAESSVASDAHQSGSDLLHFDGRLPSLGEGQSLQSGFVLVTPDSIGMDRNGNVETPTNSPSHTFRSLDMYEDDKLDDRPIKFLFDSQLGNRFVLPMKRTIGDPFESLMF